jgi:hypothetical protein
MHISINQLNNLKSYQLGSDWQSHIKIGNTKVDSIQPIQKYIVYGNEEQQLPALDKWMIYSKENGFISFKDYTISNGSQIKLPILKRYVKYYESHYSYVQNLFD